jgi:hypothetical protein
MWVEGFLQRKKKKEDFEVNEKGAAAFGVIL